ncbi:hypothetical protein PoB_007591600 [Plakobranchus ocellatus]|uniref:Uncharacterized protein n=1 Tax=Plakobranchus ocellatus TaxID=259542 RepID=A0AAV4DZZ5_9GAST|nr:hypothetical protein PoB_007591600 [Plakobranchus ocellatus]
MKRYFIFVCHCTDGAEAAAAAAADDDDDDDDDDNHDDDKDDNDASSVGKDGMVVVVVDVMMSCFSHLVTACLEKLMPSFRQTDQAWTRQRTTATKQMETNAAKREGGCFGNGQSGSPSSALLSVTFNALSKFGICSPVLQLMSCPVLHDTVDRRNGMEEKNTLRVDCRGVLNSLVALHIRRQRTPTALAK